MQTYLTGVKAAKVQGYQKPGEDLSAVRVLGPQAPQIVQALERRGLKAREGGGPAPFLLASDLQAPELEALAPKLQEMGTKGVVACPVSAEKPLSYWREKVPQAFDVLEDTEQGWTEGTRGEYLKSVMFLAPSIYPVREDLRYAGIERLVALMANEMARRGYTVYVVAAEGTALHPKAWWVNAGVGAPAPGDVEEEASYLAARQVFEGRQIDVVHDFSHRHLLMRRHKVPGVAMIWHDPWIMSPPMPSYNVATLSQWQANRFKETTKQDARALDVVCSKPSFYEPFLGQKLRPAYTTLGKMGPTKGNLTVAQMCYAAGVGLDVIGGLGVGDDPVYLQQILKLQRDDPERPIVVWGEVSEEAKAQLLATSQGLLYAPDFGKGMGESHLHKAIDAAMAGCPSLLLDQGAYRECMDPQAALFARDVPDMQRQLSQLAHFDRKKVREWAVARYSVEAVVDRWIPTYEKIQSWESWA